MLEKTDKQRGYTIIETMIAISVFLIAVMSGMGALLNANLLHQKSQDMRSIIDNLSFIMEDMSRNIRTGYNYRCISDGNFSSNINSPRSCNSGGAIAFESASGNKNLDTDQWVYKIESQDGGVTFNISRSVAGGAAGSWVQLNSSEININSFSGFSVVGALPTSGDNQQPFVIIKLVGEINYKDIETPFNLETSVSQRLSDI